MYQYWIRLKRRRRNNQKGFTLIELLVVISILGILAAVVTMSMVGVTRLAQQRAADTEKQSVQLAMDSMAAEQQVAEADICSVPKATTDMSLFPAGGTPTTVSSTPPLVTPAGHSVALYPRYLRQQNTHGSYTCDAGQVTQTGFNP
jgi:prepilin-type N-terminal cleavage/methylation domain-containing protein